MRLPRIISNFLFPEPKSRDDIGKDLRRLILNMKPAELGLATDEDFPNVYGLVTDWSIGKPHIGTIVALRDGTASLYTTSSFGVIGGGEGHEKVRVAAIECVKKANQQWTDSVRATNFQYPNEGEVLFYFLTYDGVRVSSAAQSEINLRQHSLASLFDSVQAVLTEIRLVSEP